MITQSAAASFKFHNARDTAVARCPGAISCRTAVEPVISSKQHGQPSKLGNYLRARLTVVQAEAANSMPARM